MLKTSRRFVASSHLQVLSKTCSCWVRWWWGLGPGRRSARAPRSSSAAAPRTARGRSCGTGCSHNDRVSQEWYDPNFDKATTMAFKGSMSLCRVWLTVTCRSRWRSWGGRRGRWSRWWRGWCCPPGCSPGSRWGRCKQGTWGHRPNLTSTYRAWGQCPFTIVTW